MRPGAGRPRGARDGHSVPAVKSEAKAAATKKRTPLDYMLSVMNDAEADPVRRDRMAQAAAPYVHPKAEPVKESKADEVQRQAREADQGTGWSGLLN